MSASSKLIEWGLLPLAGALAVAIGAWFSFPVPGSDIPQTGQTIAVLVAGALLGPHRGALALVVYLLLGAMGLPVYSDGGAGWAVLLGSSAGYFIGFVAAAAVTGYLLARKSGNVLRVLACMLLGHGVILALGWAWLALALGPYVALQQGVSPFVYGGLVKSVLATVLVAVYTLIMPRLVPANGASA